MQSAEFRVSEWSLGLNATARVGIKPEPVHNTQHVEMQWAIYDVRTLEASRILEPTTSACGFEVDQKSCFEAPHAEHMFSTSLKLSVQIILCARSQVTAMRAQVVLVVLSCCESF